MDSGFGVAALCRAEVGRGSSSAKWGFRWLSGRAAMVGMLLTGVGCATPTGPGLEDSGKLAATHAWALEAAQRIDAHRATLGCAPLQWHHGGASVAEAYARQMSDEQFFGHVDPAGTTLKQRLNRAGISGYRLAAETIAAGQDTPTKVVADWLASRDHKAIVEDCQFNHVGLGFHEGSGPYREYWTAVFFAAR